ncbi:MAG: alpha/beta hydrolase [Candidatus Spechtbacterales bacterium]|nr:alpha/beta hydrolase [Candidatus Spechtbacterales bacterium]
MTTPFILEPKYTTIAGRKVRYVKYGQGPPLVLLHGLGRTVFQWKEHIPEFAKTNTVYALDMPGFGHSEPLMKHERVMSFAPMFLRQFMQHFDLDKPVILGGSFGGLAAMDFALEFPNNLSKLILMDSAGLGREVSLGYRLLTLPIIGELWRYLDYNGIEDSEIWINRVTRVPKLGKILATVLEYILTPPPKERLDNTIEANRLTPLRLYRYGIHLLGGQRLSIRREGVLHRIQVPTLVMWGELDPIFPVSHAYKAYERLPNPYNVKLFDPGPYIFRGVGHWPPRESPREFQSVVKEFLAS